MRPLLYLLILMFALVTVGILGVPVAFYNILTSKETFVRAMGAITLLTAFPMIFIWAGLLKVITLELKEKP